MENELAYQSFVLLMKAAKSMQERMKHECVKYGLSPTEFSVLEDIYHKGKQNVHQICSSVFLASGSMTYVIDKLVQKNLLERSDCHKDRRVVYVDMTDRGKELMEKIFPEHQRLIRDIFEDVTIDEKKTMINVLQNIGQKKEFK